MTGFSIVVAGLSGGTAGTITNSTGGSVSLTVSQSGTKTTFGGSIQDGEAETSFQLTSGTLVLAGTNTYTGGTFVSGGKLIVTNDEAIEDGSNLTIGNPTLFGAVVPVPARRPWRDG